MKKEPVKPKFEIGQLVWVICEYYEEVITVCNWCEGQGYMLKKSGTKLPCPYCLGKKKRLNNLALWKLESRNRRRVLGYSLEVIEDRKSEGYFVYAHDSSTANVRNVFRTKEEALQEIKKRNEENQAHLEKRLSEGKHY